MTFFALTTTLLFVGGGGRINETCLFHCGHYMSIQKQVPLNFFVLYKPLTNANLDQRVLSPDGPLPRTQSFSRMFPDHLKIAVFGCLLTTRRALAQVRVIIC